jgi:ligand-binding sensor domain-containing protein
MWFGTWDGLNKFDGYNFTIYNVSDGLNDHTILCMVEDKDGNMWIGTNRGLNKFNRQTQTFQKFDFQTRDSINPFMGSIRSIVISGDSLLWVGTRNGLYQFNPETEEYSGYFTSLSQDLVSPRSNSINHVFEANDGILWLSTTYGLVKFDPQTKRSTRYYHVPNDEGSLSNNYINCVIQDVSGNFWIGTRKGLNFYDSESQKITRFIHNPANPNSISGNDIRSIYEAKNGQIWIGTYNKGLNVYDKERNEFKIYKWDINTKSSISNNRIFSLLEDNTGNVWIGTYMGINKINKHINSFIHHQVEDENTRKLNSQFIWDFFVDDENDLWIATSEGVNIIDSNTGRFRYILHDPDNSNSLSGNEVRSMLYDPDQNCVWLGLFGMGLNKYNLETQEIRHYLPDVNKNSISSSFVIDMARDKKGNIWLGTSRGLNKLNPVNNTFEVFENINSDTTSLSNDVVFAVFIDRDDNIWAGTNLGLNLYNPLSNKFVRYFFDVDKNASANTIFSINQDYSGRLWLGTSGGGLIRFYPETGDYKIYTTNEGLPNNIVYGVQFDHDNNLWLSTNLGLAKFYVIGERFVNYDVKDGIQSYEFNLGSSYKDQDGKMYFGGMNGYNVFDPGEITTNLNKPVIVVSAFRKFNEKQPTEYFNGDTIVLNHDDNFFSFEIAALDYTNPMKNKYMYYLENFDKDWIRGDASHRFAEYKKVQPGSYTFYAKGSNNDGIWNQEGIKLTIVINPPWYKTLIFRVSFITLLVFLVWFLITRRIRVLNHRHRMERKMLEIEKQKFELEQKTLQLQMNPHFIFNSLNSIQSFILTHNTKMAVTYLGKFSRLMRLILNNSGKKYVVLKEELMAIQHYLELEKLRFDNKFLYALEVDEKIDTEFIEIPPMIIQPFIENAIIHGILHKPDKGFIEIRLLLRDDKLAVSITDDGVGRKKAEEIKQKTGIKRKSKGMGITQERLAMLNKDIFDGYSAKIIDLKDDAGNPNGTRVELLIHYLED